LSFILKAELPKRDNGALDVGNVLDSSNAKLICSGCL